MRSGRPQVLEPVPLDGHRTDVPFNCILAYSLQKFTEVVTLDSVRFQQMNPVAFVSFFTVCGCSYLGVCNKTRFLWSGSSPTHKILQYINFKTVSVQIRYYRLFSIPQQMSTLAPTTSPCLLKFPLRLQEDTEIILPMDSTYTISFEYFSNVNYSSPL